MAIQPDEDSLIRAAQHGDMEAFNRLVLTHQGQVYAVAYRLLDDGEAAADVCQETFLSAYQHIQSFRSGSLRAWLLRIATNLCYDILRRRRAHPVSPLEILFTRSEPTELQRPEEHDPETRLELQELGREIQSALATLPPAQRVAVILCDIEGFAYRDAAELLQISLGTLKSRLNRGRGRIRDHFFDHMELLPASLRSILGKALQEGERNAPADQQEEPDDVD